MSNVWFCVPSKRPRSQSEPIFRKWQEQGYKVAISVDPEHESMDGAADAVFRGPYQGYSKSVNFLVHWILANDPECQWVVTGGDDMEPDHAKRADVIAGECSAYFHNRMELTYPPSRPKWAYRMPSSAWATFGVMQPVGDVWACDVTRICGSPWMGREFCERAYAGQGPMWHEYFHMFNDSEMLDVCLLLNCLWQRSDLSHYHHHWMREGGIAPAFLERANSRDNWNRMKAIYENRKAHGFPGHEPPPITVPLDVAA